MTTGQISLQVQCLDLEISTPTPGEEKLSESNALTDKTCSWVAPYITDAGIQCSIRCFVDTQSFEWKTSKTNPEPKHSCDSKRWRNTHPRLTSEDGNERYKSARTWLEAESCEFDLNEQNMTTMIPADLVLDVRLGQSWDESSPLLGSTRVPLEKVLHGFPTLQECPLDISVPRDLNDDSNLDDGQDSYSATVITGSIQIRLWATPSVAHYAASGVLLYLRDCVVEEPPQEWINHLIEVCNYREQVRLEEAGQVPPKNGEEESEPSINIHPTTLAEAQDLKRIAESCADWTVRCTLNLSQVSDSPQLVVDGLKLRFHFFEALETVDPVEFVSDDEHDESDEGKSSENQDCDDAELGVQTTKTVLKTWWSVGSNDEDGDDAALFLDKVARSQLVSGIKDGQVCNVVLMATPTHSLEDSTAPLEESKTQGDATTTQHSPPPKAISWTSTVQIDLSPLLDEQEDCMNARCDLIVEEQDGSQHQSNDDGIEKHPRISVVIATVPCLNPEDGELLLFQQEEYSESKINLETLEAVNNIAAVRSRCKSTSTTIKRGLKDLNVEIAHVVQVVKEQLRERRLETKHEEPKGVQATKGKAESKQAEMHVLPVRRPSAAHLLSWPTQQGNSMSLSEGVLETITRSDKTLFHRIRFAVLRFLREEYSIDNKDEYLDTKSSEFVQEVISKVYHRIADLVQTNTSAEFQSTANEHCYRCIDDSVFSSTKVIPRPPSTTTSSTSVGPANEFAANEDEAKRPESAGSSILSVGSNRSRSPPNVTRGDDQVRSKSPATLSRSSTDSFEQKRSDGSRISCRRRESLSKQQQLECTRLKQHAKDAELIGNVGMAQTAWQNLLAETASDTLASGCAWVEYGCFCARNGFLENSEKCFREALVELDANASSPDFALSSLEDHETSALARCSSLVGLSLLSLNVAENPVEPALETLTQGLSCAGPRMEHIFKAGINLACDMGELAIPKVAYFGQVPDTFSSIAPLQEFSKMALDLCLTSVAQGAVALAIRRRRRIMEQIQAPSSKRDSVNHRMSGTRRSRGRAVSTSSGTIPAAGAGGANGVRAATAPQQETADVIIDQSQSEFELITALLRARAKYIEGKALACVDILESAYNSLMAGSSSQILNDNLWLKAEVCFTLADGYISLGQPDRRGQSRKWLAMALSAIREADEHDVELHPLSRGITLYPKVAYKFGTQATLDGEVRAARAVFLNATRNPATCNSCWSWTGLGATCLRTGELKYALAALEKALTFDVDNAVSWAYLCIVVVKLRGVHAAQLPLQQALDLGLHDDSILLELQSAFESIDGNTSHSSKPRKSVANIEQVKLIQSRRRLVNWANNRS